MTPTTPTRTAVRGAAAAPVPDTLPDTGIGAGFGWDSQVVLFNDEVHSFDEAIEAVETVFGHPAALAAKIVAEAHVRGRAIAEVEARKEAEAHAAALRARGFGAEVESIADGA